MLEKNILELDSKRTEKNQINNEVNEIAANRNKAKIEIEEIQIKKEKVERQKLKKSILYMKNTLYTCKHEEVLLEKTKKT